MRPPRPDRFDVVVVGSHFADWLKVLAPGSDIWAQLPEVASVRHEPTGWMGGGEGAERRLVLPLLEHNIRACPPGWRLVPPTPALETFADKARFAEFVEASGLGPYAPQTYANADVATYPCVLKRTNLFASHGVRVVYSREELDESLEEQMWAGHPYILQEFIEDDVDYSINGVAVDGILRFDCGYRFDLPEGELIRVPQGEQIIDRHRFDARNLFAFQRFIALSNFSGPFNAGMRFRPSGTMAVIEINPRFGGQMFRTSTLGDLVSMLRVIMQNATWQPPVG